MTENGTPTVVDLAQLVQDAQDAEPLRQAVLDALAIWDDVERSVTLMEATDERMPATIAGQVRRRRADAGKRMAERLRELHRVPIEQTELDDEEMAAAGFLPASVVVPDLDPKLDPDSPEFDDQSEPDPIEHTDQVADWANIDAEQDERDRLYGEESTVIAANEYDER